MKKFTSVLLSTILCAMTLAPVAAYGQRGGTLPGASAAAGAKFRKNADAIPNRYIVVFNESVAKNKVKESADELARAHGGTIGFIYKHALRGFSVEMNEAQATALSRNPQVAFVEADMEVAGASIQTGAPSPLDRLDQRDLPLNNSYNYASNGAGVNAYIIDGGIRLTHQEFGGRAVFAFDNVGDGRAGVDCNGHGTHVAGLIGGATYGVAKGVKLHSVRVLNCSNQALVSRVIAGIDWVAANHVKPAVANMSFFVGNASDAMDLSVRAMIAAGVTTVAAAGNLSRDASLHSPARVREAITVAATDLNDNRLPSSNFGPVVDVFAPGDRIVSAHYLDDASVFTRSGTSSAAPFVAGLAARYLGARPGDQPDAVEQAIRNSATPGKVFNPGEGSPNRLAYAGITISDDFNDNARDAVKWNLLTTPGASIAEQNGRLEVTPAAAMPGYDGYLSATTLDLTDARSTVEAVSVPTTN
ncbi:MAG: serine protease, partial [Pyrinomonadaceae bacterium]|nr:serine protease [Pyrinomonadaceae bacterium]